MGYTSRLQGIPRPLYYWITVKAGSASLVTSRSRGGIGVPEGHVGVSGAVREPNELVPVDRRPRIDRGPHRPNRVELFARQGRGIGGKRSGIRRISLAQIL